jgi:hypothetical protein
LAGLAATLLFMPPGSIPSGDESNNLQQQADLLNNRFGFLMLTADRDMRVAEALGMYLEHKHGKQSGKGMYELVWNGCADGFACDTTWILVDYTEKSEPSMAPQPQLTELEKCLELHWELPEITEFSGFYIYRKDASGKEEKINPGIVIPAVRSGRGYYRYRDSVPNYEMNTYFIKGVNAFGELSKPSADISGMARDFTPPAAAQDLKAETGKLRSINLTWKKAEKTEVVKHQIHLSNAIDGPYEPISNVFETEENKFEYTLPGDYDAAFFKVLSLDSIGNGSWSLPAYGFIPDSIPPAIPGGLKGFIDTNAVVTLSWNAGEDRDIIGYRVFYANAADHLFTNLSGKPLADTVYRDTIAKATLTRDIYYRIVAVDRNYNHSEPSAPIRLKRPDHIPPVPAVIHDAKVNETGLELSWINSSSADLAGIRLLIRKQGESKWLEIEELKIQPLPQKHVFSGLATSTWYEVTIESADSSGHRTMCEKPYAFRTFDRGIRPAPEHLKANRLENKKAIELSWEGNFPAGSKVLVYRKAPAAPGLTKYDLVTCTGKYTDEKISPTGNYEYTIKIIYPDGGESIPVDAVMAGDGY